MCASVRPKASAAFFSHRNWRGFRTRIRTFPSTCCRCRISSLVQARGGYRGDARTPRTGEHPEQGQYVYTKLCDYRLQLYATHDYLEAHAPIRSKEALRGHRFASYIDDLAFSYELLYLERAVPGAVSNWRSTNVIAQYFAVLQGRALAILPCFMVSRDTRLVAVLPDEIVVTRAFFLSCREDLRKLRRITAVCGITCGRQRKPTESF